MYLLMDFLHFMDKGNVVQSNYGPGFDGMPQPLLDFNPFA